MEVKELELLKKYIDGKVENIGDSHTSSEAAQAAGFPFQTEFLNSYLVSDTAQQIELAGAQHYLIYYRTYDNVAFELHEGQEENDAPAAAEINMLLLGEEIDLYYRPYDFDENDPQAAVKVFGTGMYVTSDENNPGSLTVAPPSAGETGICLVFAVSPTPSTTALAAIYSEEGTIEETDGETEL